MANDYKDRKTKRRSVNNQKKSDDIINDKNINNNSKKRIDSKKVNSVKVKKTEVKKENPKIEEIEIIGDDDEVKEKRKYKKRIKKSEKIFVLLNIFVILVIIGYYAYRTIYYYKKEHHVEENITLKSKITKIDNITYQGDGLYEKDDYYYFKGNDVNNYVYYSGRLYRIIDINNGIRMIEDNNITNLVWGMEERYNESLIHTWLNNYLNTLKDYEYYLQKNTFCNSLVDVEKYACEEKIEDYVGLISIEDYLLVGGKNSYLNNETYYWTLNKDKDSKALYINKEGSINNYSSSDDNYFSYGVRPVITLKEEISYIDGNGSKNSPYIIEELGSAMLKDNSVGNYVKYRDELFRIIGCKILDPNYTEDEEPKENKGQQKQNNIEKTNEKKDENKIKLDKKAQKTKEKKKRFC